jgi:hypothetical protein
MAVPFDPGDQSEGPLQLALLLNGSGIISHYHNTGSCYLDLKTRRMCAKWEILKAVDLRVTKERVHQL